MVTKNTILKTIVCDRTNQTKHNVAEMLGVFPEEIDCVKQSFVDRVYGWTKKRLLHEQPPVRVALLYSHLDNYIETAAARQMVASLNEAYGTTQNFEFTVFSAENDMETLEEILNEDFAAPENNRYEVCVAFAPWIVSRTRDVFTARSVDVPLLFGGIASPEKLGLLDPNGKRPYNMSGVVSRIASHDAAVSAVRHLNPKLKRLLVPYDSDLTHAGWPERCYGSSGSFSESWKKSGGKIRPIDIAGVKDIATAITNAAKSPEILVNLSVHSRVLAQTDEIIKACNEHGIPLYAHSRQAVRRGAVLGSGGSSDLYGAWLAMLIGEMCIEKRSLQEIDIPFVTEKSEVCFFEESLATQGFAHLDKNTLLMMRMLPIHQVGG